METPSSPFARPAAALIAVIALGSLALQIWANLDRDGSALAAAGAMLRYFTIWSNLGAGLVLGWVALSRRMPAVLLHMLATALTIVGLVYWTLLAAMHHPAGLERFTNQLHHTIVPVATILWWFVFAPLPRHAARSVGAVMIMPVAYAVFALTHGARTGFYPYFFLDRTTLSWSQVAVNIAGLALLFALCGVLLLAVKRWLGARAKTI